MAAGLYNFEIEQGATLELPLWFNNPDGSAIDLTGFSARLQARRTKASTDVIFELSTDDGGITVDDGPGGQLTLHMDAAATSTLRFSSAYYDLYLTGASNKPSRELEGRVSVSEQVTR